MWVHTVIYNVHIYLHRHSIATLLQWYVIICVPPKNIHTEGMEFYAGTQWHILRDFFIRTPIYFWVFESYPTTQEFPISIWKKYGNFRNCTFL